jgi:hypothetical protein
MKFKENRPLAWILVIVCVIASTLIGSYVSLSSKRTEVINSFYDNMDNDLNTKSSYADNLAGIASRYIDADSGYITSMTQARTQLTKAETAREKYLASVAITNAASALYDVLGTMELTETDERLRRSNYADILSVDDILSRSSYNSDVEEFNAQLTAFPANILSAVTGVEAAEYFR